MSSRPTLSLDGDWLLYLDPAGPLDPGRRVDMPNVPPRLARVPAPIQALDDDLHEYTGAAWYRREFEVPAGWLDGRSLIIHFSAAEYFATVWVNDQFAGSHEGGYLPFELDVTAAAQPGSNTITVYVSDPPELFRELPHGKQSWYGPLSGLWQSVVVESRTPRHLLAVRVTTEGNQARVNVDLSQPLEPGATLTYDILAPDGETAATLQTTAAEALLTVAGAQPWELDSPVLYTLQVTCQGPAGTDSLSDTFGFRTFTTRGGYLELNGRPLYLIGALDQDYYPDLICTPPSQEYIEAEFHKAKALGLNCMRVHIKIADPRYYAAADRVGLLIWTEIPNWSDLNPNTIRRARELIAGSTGTTPPSSSAPSSTKAGAPSSTTTPTTPCGWRSCTTGPKASTPRAWWWITPPVRLASTCAATSTTSTSTPPCPTARRAGMPPSRNLPAAPNGCTAPPISPPAAPLMTSRR
jgi:beta-galactosidase/beta-glucuronidase